MADPKSTPATDEELQELIAEAETGARNPTGAIPKKILFYVPLLWTLFQLWYASPLPFMLNVFIVNDAEARAIHLGFAVFLGFMAFPALSRDPGGRVPFVAIALAILPTLMFTGVVLSGDAPTGDLLFPLALAPAFIGMAGPAYGAAAAGLGGLFVLSALGLRRGRGDGPARRMFGFSIFYLF